MQTRMNDVEGEVHTVSEAMPISLSLYTHHNVKVSELLNWDPKFMK